ncbi:hypothetical protein NDU88_002934 [Pleurodeles waltl]|uniref:Uncharacterized protein n=1 Tax=Pleurodeles waltl TaxID=8319 RepID=A0AAV7VE12_PLEWA|nr:hypothetical protein NDU88_002934 [Pleurodeles waltl]
MRLGPGEREESACVKEQVQPGEAGLQGKRCDCGSSGTCPGLGTAPTGTAQGDSIGPAISASPVALESETENSQPPCDRPTMPDRLSELGFQEFPSVTPATENELF